jgi:hypothetical protein
MGTLVELSTLAVAKHAPPVVVVVVVVVVCVGDL